MTTTFTTFAFPATGAPTNRTLPARLAEVKNVKDFGAKGDGVTDDWAAIMAAFNWTVLNARGTLFFPPGTYYVSQPLDFGHDDPTTNINVNLQGVGPLSVITGNFADYVIRRGFDTTGGVSGSHVISDLAVINTNALGGGIRWGLNTGAALRNLSITANKALNLGSVDHGGSIVSQETSVENCILSPGSHPTGSIGFMTTANGPIANCSIIGFETGAMAWGQQGGHLFMGCRFELCDKGISPGQAPGSAPGDPGSGLYGCHFKDCRIAIDLSASGGCVLAGTVIESTGAAVFGSTPQYGITGASNISSSHGVFITGPFAQAGIDMSAVAGSFKPTFLYHGVSVNNTAGDNWRLPLPSSPFNASKNFLACNVAPVWTMGQLPAAYITINSAAWTPGVIWELTPTTRGSGYVDGFYNNVPLTGGTGTGATLVQVGIGGGEVLLINSTFRFPGLAFPVFLGTGYTVGDVLSVNNADLGGSGSGFSITVTEAHDSAVLTTPNNIGPYVSEGLTFNTNVQGISPSGYNGIQNGAVAVTNVTMGYALANPGGSGGSGTALINPVQSGAPNAIEGDGYNVSDASSATWGANPVGGGSTHAKVRWGAGTNWTVMGK